MHIPILHQDDDIIVVNKPAGIPTHAADPADPYLGDALRIVKAQTGLPYLGMHQRLDAETSGVLLFAARREANAALARAFEGRGRGAQGLPGAGARDAETGRGGDRCADRPGARRALSRHRGGRSARVGRADALRLWWRRRDDRRRTTDDDRHDGSRHAHASRITFHAARNHPRDRPAAPDSRPPGAHRLPGGRRSALRPAAAPCAAAVPACLSTDHPAPDDGAAGDVHCARPDFVRAPLSRTSRVGSGGLCPTCPRDRRQDARRIARSAPPGRRAPCASGCRSRDDHLPAGQRRRGRSARHDRRPLRRCARLEPV